MNVFDECETATEVVDLLDEMKTAGTLNFNQEMLAELRLIEIQTKTAALSKRGEQNSSPSTSGAKNIRHKRGGSEVSVCCSVFFKRCYYCIAGFTPSKDGCFGM